MKFEFTAPLLIPAQNVAHDGRATFNSYVMSNHGVITAVSETGQVLWRTQVPTTWHERNPHSLVQPSLQEFKFHSYHYNTSYIVAQGDSALAVVDLQGNVVGSVDLQLGNEPTTPLLFVDMNGDGNDDLVVVSRRAITPFRMTLIPSVQFLPACIAILIGLITYQIYLTAVTYYKRRE